MAKINSIAQTLGNMQQTIAPTNGSTSVSSTYTPNSVLNPISTPSGATQVLGSLMEFAKTGSAAYQEYDKFKTQEADTRSNEILEKLSPEQRAAALQNGTLLYQDDPWTMKALKTKVAQNASLMADNQIMENIKKGTYNSQKDLHDDMYNSRAQAGQQAAEINGFDFNDPDYQKGYATNASQRNYQIQETQAQWESGQIQKTKKLHDAVSLSGFINTTPQSDANNTAQGIYDYIVSSGGSYDDQVQLISQAIQGLSGVAGGAQVIQKIRGMDFKLYGQTANIDQLYGKEGVEQYISKAGMSNYASNRESRNLFQDRAAIASTTDDLNVAQSTLSELSLELDRTQPGQYDTPERKQLDQIKEGILRKQAAQAQQRAQLFAQQAQQDNRAEVLYNQMSRAANGDTTAVVDFNGQTTNISSGNYTKEDSINAANRYYSNVMNNDKLTTEEKTNSVLNLAATTPKEQGINIVLKEKFNLASSEMSSAGLKGQLDFSKTPNLNNLIQMYKTNPSALASALAGDNNSMKLYGQLATLNGMVDNGIDPTIFITGQQKMASMDAIQQADLQKNSNTFYTRTFNDSRFKGMGGLPAQISKSIFENYYASTNDIDGATTAARIFLNNNVVDVSSSESGSNGQLLKSSLQVTPNVRSVQIGKDIVNSKVNDLVKQYPVLKGKLNISTASDGTIMITDPSTALKGVTGQSYIRITRQDLQQEYAKQLQIQKEANDKAVSKEEQRILNTPKVDLSYDAYGTFDKREEDANLQKNPFGGLTKQ